MNHRIVESGAKSGRYIVPAPKTKFDDCDDDERRPTGGGGARGHMRMRRLVTLIILA